MSLKVGPPHVPQFEEGKVRVGRSPLQSNSSSSSPSVRLKRYLFTSLLSSSILMALRCLSGIDISPSTEHNINIPEMLPTKGHTSEYFPSESFCTFFFFPPPGSMASILSRTVVAETCFTFARFPTLRMYPCGS